MREQDGMQASALQPPTTGDPKAWIAYWKAQAQTLGTEPEINAKRQKVQERKQLVGNGIKIENLIANGDQRWRKTSMVNRIRIGLIGDYNPEVKAHIAIPRAVALASRARAIEAETSWLPTPLLESLAEEELSTYDALWCVPASPYASMDGALRGIRFAREHGYPFLGTCGGFQHAVIEYTRNVLGFTEADHAESNPNATMPMMVPLSCSLMDAQGTIQLLPNTRIARIYGSSETVEHYFCNFGLNPDFKSLLEQSEMQITGVDENGEARVIELARHPFFIGTLFQPELSAYANVAHPLIMAFLQTIAEVSPRNTQVRFMEE